ncbi:40S ribosomal protein S15-like isoform X4 [Populus alba x Populus x berolinensis]|uniref:40S ribosomal protein S15-like isoform X4 n=1 Tax=Populus alba x Populus x berolinensis TaxID=444605 RepID=A0AAD6QTE5_9ROSI|nr:40S ribosomal protein S15-like isoform X4 [Populus alba]KAJ6996282.1 40S ribosomal protein S15-like isoform X4 [Populus alba x Populus x berolinensis]
MSTDVLVNLFPARACCRFQRGVKRKPMASIKKLREAVRKGRPQMVRSQREPLRTHLRNMIIVLEMSCHYLAGFPVSYKPVMHGRPGHTLPDSFLSSEMGHLIWVAVDFLRLFSFSN